MAEYEMEMTTTLKGQTDFLTFFRGRWGTHQGWLS